MKIPEDMWIVDAAEKWIELCRVRRAQGDDIARNGEPEHIAYAEALDGAFAMEGLKPRRQGVLKEYGTPEQQKGITLRVMMTAIELLIDTKN